MMPLIMQQMKNIAMPRKRVRLKYRVVNGEGEMITNESSNRLDYIRTVRACFIESLAADITIISATPYNP